jgi:hypothetical protein
VKAVQWVGAVALLLVVAGLAFVRVCADGGGMGAAYTECRCGGIERVLYDRTPADGPRRTICIGIVRARRCFRFMGGPEVDCRSRRAARRAR